MEEQQLTPQVLGQPHQEPGLCVRHRQEQHRRLLPLRHRSDIHGRLLNVGADLGQRLSELKAPLRQRHSSLQRLGGPVLRRHQGHAGHFRSGHERDAGGRISLARQRVQPEQRAARALPVRRQVQRATHPHPGRG